MIEIKNITKTYKTTAIATQALKNVSFKINDGEFVAIMGPSGSGKSTLMHILGFLDRPTSGSYIFKGQAMANFDDDKLASIRNAEVGFVFQSYFLLAKTTVWENVKLPLIYNNCSDKDQRVASALKEVGLEHRLHHLSNQLSGGEKQRVVIARALVNNPSIIFADEPTGNLDSKSGQEVMQILKKINKEGKTVIIVTHDQSVADQCGRTIRLYDGQISRKTK